jgi:hypothetical protein
VNDRDNLRQFIASEGALGEVDAAAIVGRLRHDSFVEQPWNPHEELMPLPTASGAPAERAIGQARHQGGRGPRRRVLDVVDVRLRRRDALVQRLVSRSGDRFSRLRTERRGASCIAMTFLVPLLLARPQLAENVSGPARLESLMSLD